MVKAIVIKEAGGPEVLKWTDVQVGKPAAGQILLQHEAVGLNFIDVYHRTGLYPLEYPAIIGLEGAGHVLEVGEGVSHLNVGDRVAYGTEIGGYAQQRLIGADRVVKIPDGISAEVAASSMLQGLTVQYLLRQTYKVKAGDTILFHAAAGGVGLIACQWAKALGATIIGTVGSDEKAALAKANGCTHTINYNEHNFVEAVKNITGGAGVAAVYDSIGQDTYPQSLDCLQPLGTWVTFGQASGPITDFNLALLAQKGSLFATRPSLMTYAAKPEALASMAADLFSRMLSGDVQIKPHQSFALADAGDAHEALTGRKTTGSTVLLP